MTKAKIFSTCVCGAGGVAVLLRVMAGVSAVEGLAFLAWGLVSVSCSSRAASSFLAACQCFGKCIE